jgi:hypothetical protein
MLARLAAHINQGQLAVAGLGGGGEGAIVIDDNCTVSTFNEFGRRRNCLLVRSGHVIWGLNGNNFLRPLTTTPDTKGIGGSGGIARVGTLADLGVHVLASKSDFISARCTHS